MARAGSGRPSSTHTNRRRLVASVLVAITVPVTLLARFPSRAVAREPASSSSTSPGDESFDTLMQQAMARMDAGMMVAPSGDPDRDFARMMIPHHQGAVDMALAELRYGHDERLRRLAQAIVIEQRQEIEVMQKILAGMPAGRPTSRSTH
jgi:hypothetical protein